MFALKCYGLILSYSSLDPEVIIITLALVVVFVMLRERLTGQFGREVREYFAFNTVSLGRTLENRSFQRMMLFLCSVLLEVLLCCAAPSFRYDLATLIVTLVCFR